MSRSVRKHAPDYPLFPRGWTILGLALMSWSALVGVAGSVVALIALIGGAA